MASLDAQCAIDLIACICDVLQKQMSVVCEQLSANFFLDFDVSNITSQTMQMQNTLTHIFARIPWLTMHLERHPGWFLADRTNGHAYATVLRLSSSSVTLCIVLGQKLLSRAYRKSYMTPRDLDPNMLRARYLENGRI